MAILFALKSLRMLITNKHVKILTDSTTVVFYITNMGGIQSITCDKISRDIWVFCIENNIWVPCSHIAGKENDADKPKSLTIVQNGHYQLNVLRPFVVCLEHRQLISLLLD